MFTRNKLEDMIYFIPVQSGKFMESNHLFFGIAVGLFME